jgi:hypothetical protein
VSWCEGGTGNNAFLVSDEHTGDVYLAATMQATRARLLSMRAGLSVHFIDCELDAARRIIAHDSLLGTLRKPFTTAGVDGSTRSRSIREWVRLRSVQSFPSLAGYGWLGFSFETSAW